MRVLYIGCVESSRVFLETVLQVPGAEVVGILTRRQSAFNSDFVSLADIAKRYQIPCAYQEETTEENLLSWMRNLHADILYCFGWSYLLSEDAIRTARLGGVGYHPAALPANRGRHPIIWALALGLPQTASTFFFLDEKADSGDILSQQSVDITDEDDAASLYEKLMEIGKQQVRQFTKALIDGTHTRMPQDSSHTNIWRKRGHKDGIIDWRMPARGIYNLVRALTHPYVGASFLYNGEEKKVWKAAVVDEETAMKNIEPGRIIKLSADGMDVQCGAGIVRLLVWDEFPAREGECLP